MNAPPEILVWIETDDASSPGQTARIDLDRFEDVLARIAASPSGRDSSPPFAGGPPTFRSLEDFEPLAIARRTPELRALLDARDAAGDPRRCEELLRRSGIEIAAPSKTGQPSSPEAAAENFDSNADLLAAIVGGRPAETAPLPPTPEDEATSLVDRLVASLGIESVSRDAAERRDATRRAISRALGSALERVLGHPAVVALEAQWRGLWWLVREAHPVPLHVVHSPQGDLSTTIAAALAARREQPGARPFTHVATTRPFSPDPGDLERLAALGEAARTHGAILVAGADRALAHDESGRLGPEFPGADALVIAYPRFLLRLPWHEAIRPAEGVPMNETHLVWGDAALAAVSIPARRASREDPRIELEVHGHLSLPVLVEATSTGDGAWRASTEEPLGDSQIRELRRRGRTPLVAYRDTNFARFRTFQTLSGRALDGV